MFKTMRLFTLATLLSPALATTFFPTANWTDTDGNLIQAHGGAILQATNSSDRNWYWFGEDKTGDSALFQGVNCYRSSDLGTWERVGHVLSPIAGTNISSDRIVERPKVIYNEKNAEYVMWFHGDLAYGLAQVGVATSKAIDQPYTWKGNFKPFGNDSRDMTIWKDPDDNTAYLIFATNGNADLEIASLDADYYNVDKALYTFPSVFWEAPGVFKINGVFYLLFSRQDGWTPTDNYYMTATSMAGPWSTPTPLSPEGSVAYLSQNAYDLVIEGSSSVFRLYYGDHWNGNALGSSTYSFYPAVFNGSTLSLPHTGGWNLDIASGTWSDLDFETITAAQSTTIAASQVQCKDGCTGGVTANMTATQSFSFKWLGEPGPKMMGIQYTYYGPKNIFKHIAVSVNGVVANGNALPESTLGDTFAQEAPFPVTLSSGDQVELTLLDFDGDEFFIDGVKIYDIAS